MPFSLGLLKRKYDKLWVALRSDLLDTTGRFVKSKEHLYEMFLERDVDNEGFKKWWIYKE